MPVLASLLSSLRPVKRERRWHGEAGDGMLGAMADTREYRLLLEKIDAKTAAIAHAHAGELACARGCHACCAPGLTVTAVEAREIAQFLEQHPDAARRARTLAQTKPWQGTRCEFLDADGACIVYAARPIVCRTQGVPVVLDRGELSVCALNFRNGLGHLPPSDRVDQATVSTLLFVVDQRFGGGERQPLTFDGVTRDAT